MSDRENALLLATLIRALPAAAQLKPLTLAQLLSDPVKLSMLVRQMTLQTSLATTEQQHELALQTALARVAPQHLQALLSTLDSKEQPAVNLDKFYGEPASVQMRSSSGYEVLGAIPSNHRGFAEADFLLDAVPDRAHAAQPAQPDPLPIAGTLALYGSVPSSKMAVWPLLLGLALCAVLLVLLY